jgi:hypothetical protein
MKYVIDGILRLLGFIGLAYLVTGNVKQAIGVGLLCNIFYHKD